MAPAFRSAATAASGSGAVSLTVTKPAGVIDGDVLVAFVTIPGDRTIAAAPPNWTLLDSRTTGTASGDCTTAVYYRVAASEGASYVWDFSASVDCAAVIMAYSGVITTAPVNVSGYRLMSTSATIHTSPSVTPSSADTVTITAYGTNPAYSGDTTFTTPSGLTVRAEADPGVGTTNRAVIKVFDKATGSSSTAEKVTTLNNSAKGVAYTVTLAPLAAAELTVTVSPYRVAASATGCMFGWYEKSGGYSTLLEMEDTLETTFPLIRVYHAPDDWGTVKSTIATAIGDGKLVFSSHKLPKVANAWITFHSSSTWDADLANIIDEYKELAPTEIIVSFNHEPYGNSSSGSQKPTLGSTSDFKKAYRKFAQAFRDAGADHVKLCYCEVDSRARVYPNDPCYPGDDVVDVLGHDVYNWGNYSGHSWEEPGPMLAGIVADAKAANKPLIMGEVGCHPGGYGGHTRAQWLRDLAAYLKTGDAATYILGLCYYHVDAHNPDDPHYWRFGAGTTSTAAQVTAFKEAFSQDSYFVTEPLSPGLRGAGADSGGLGGGAPSGGTPPSVQGKIWGRKNTVSGVTISEVSGLASSPKGGAWAIRDSGKPASLYWLTQTSRGNFAAREVAVTAATNSDWEDCIYSVESGTAYIYIHDNRDGNSSGSNPKRLYKVAEPATPSTATSVALVDTRHWKFPSSASSSTCGSKQNCEAIALHKGILYAVQKTDADEAEVYRIGAPGSLGSTEGTATEGVKVGTIGTHCPSCFSISADGTHVLTIQHNETEVWRGKGDTIASLLTGKNTRVFRDQPGGSGEGADWYPYQSADFLVISEDLLTVDYDVSVGRVLTSGIPSTVAFGSPTVTLDGGPITIIGAGAIPAPADFMAEEEPGLDFGTATVTMAGSPPPPEEPVPPPPEEPAPPEEEPVPPPPEPVLVEAGIFTPPIVLANPPVLADSRGLGARLARHFGPQPVARSVVLRAGTYVTVESPDQLELAGLVDGTTYFLGGHIYAVTSAVATALTADGFTVISPPVPTGTWGTAAGFLWGEIAGYQWGAMP